MKILMATSEFHSFTNVGILGVNVKTLASEFKKLGNDIQVAIPFYRSIHEGGFKVQPTGIEFQVPLGSKSASAEILLTKTEDGIPVYLIRRDEYFDRSSVYGATDRAYEDNSERFIFFSKAVVELSTRLSPSIDIIHAHDWPTALVPVFVSERRLPLRTVLSIHTLEHQGSFWNVDFGLTNLPSHYFSASGIEFYGRLNFLKGGILYANSVTLPGEPALYESFTQEHGYGLNLVLQENANRLTGIPFGVDYTKTNPSPERLLSAKPKNGKTNPAQKFASKTGVRNALLSELNLNPAEKEGFTVHLPVETHSLNAVFPVIDQILAGGHRLIVSGEVPKEELSEVIVASRKYPECFALVPKEKSTLISAGADIILFPSGLGYFGQSVLTALRYGTLPIAKSRPGLNQLVTDVDPVDDTGFGFVYYRSSAEALWDSIQRAYQFYQKPELWQKLVKKAQSIDFSWTTTAKAFGQLYADLLRHSKRVTGGG